jgi:hypothetical protein
MKNKKEFFAVLFSVLICVLVVFAGVYAGTTTVGSDLQVNGSSASTEFSVIGTASISEDLWASGSFQFGGGEGIATKSYSRLGGTATGHSLADADDLIINGMLEVDETAYFDNRASVALDLSVEGGDFSVSGTSFFSGVASMSDANGLLIGGGAMLYGGTTSPSQALFPCPKGGWYFRSGIAQTASTSLYYCAPSDGWNAVLGIDINQ